MTMGNTNTPFLDLKSFMTEAFEVRDLDRGMASAARSPFISVYELEDGERDYEDPDREAYAALVDELYDEEFDEALFELQVHGRALHDGQLANGSSRADADHLVTQHFAQLIRESEAAVDAMAKTFGSRTESGNQGSHQGNLVAHEIESFSEHYSTSESFEPEFENFFGKLIKKVGAIAKKGLQVVQKLALGPFLGKLKALIKPLLSRVLYKAIGKLPASVRPAAQLLAQKLGFAAPRPARAATATTGDAQAANAAPENEGAAVQDSAGEDPGTLQQEFDEQVAAAMLAPEEVALELEVALVRSEASAASPVFAELDDARERFIHELEHLKEGEDPSPHIQNFLPAILPALRVGIPLIGRPRVVNFLAKFLTPLIAKLIGPAQAPLLSRAIADAGLKMLSLEISDEEQSGLAASAVAATVEETATRIASLPEHILDNQELLEGFALEAFEQAAAANLPAIFSEATYRQRPELLEAGTNAAWVLMPMRGPRRYKRCTRNFKVRITPHMAEEIEGFEGEPLSEFLQDQLGLPEGAEVEAEVQLYETLPGTTLADIAHGESELEGSAGTDEAARSQLHPLTPKAAAVLIGKPGLGRNLSAATHSQNVPAGQRFYKLMIPGKRPLTIPGAPGQRLVRRRGHVTITLDCPKDEIRVNIFMSEVKAQKVAMRLRQPANTGLMAAGFQRQLSPRLIRILRGQSPRRLRIVYGGLRPGLPTQLAFQNLPDAVRHALITRMQEWLLHGFTDLLKTKAKQFLAATEDPADGITLRFTIEHPQGLKELCKALVEKGPAVGKIAEMISKGSRPAIRVEVFPRHQCN